MLDIRFIREHTDAVAAALKERRSDIDVKQLVALDAQRRSLQQEIDTLQQQRGQLARGADSGPPPAEAVAHGKQLREKLAAAEQSYAAVHEEFTQLLLRVPNLPTADVPVGLDESANQVVREVGAPPAFDFPVQDHIALGRTLDLIDTERATKISGSRFAFLKGALAHLEFALVQLVLRVVTNPDTLQRIGQRAALPVPTTPFIPVIPPTLVTAETLQRMARLEPKEDRYFIPRDNLYLAGSAEHALGALHMDEVLAEAALPLRYVGFSTSYRRESGSYGKDVRGILRVHQFDKLELQSFCLPEASLAEQDFLVAIQEYLMQQLELPYRVMLVCTGDMGTPDARQIDIETWLPGQDRYRETHSADLTTDYQSRRLNTKVQRESGAREYVHMNDATAFAIGRTLIALLENHQRADGSVAVPAALHPYLPFTEIALPTNTATV